MCKNPKTLVFVISLCACNFKHTMSVVEIKGITYTRKEGDNGEILWESKLKDESEEVTLIHTDKEIKMLQQLNDIIQDGYWVDEHGVKRTDSGNIV